VRAHTLLQQGQQFGGQCRTNAGAPATAASVAATAAAAAMTAVAAAGTAPSSKRLSCKAAVCMGGMWVSAQDAHMVKVFMSKVTRTKQQRLASPTSLRTAYAQYVRAR
jgi:hypothetical protein